MQMSLMLLEQILGMFVMVMVGFAIARLGVANSENFKIVSQITIYVVCPATIINSYCTKFEMEKLEGLLVTALTALLIHIVYLALTVLFNRGKRGLIPEEQASVIYSNAGNLVLPLVTSTIGSEYAFYVATYIMIQNFFMWTHGYHILGSKEKVTLKKILSNPCIISILVGIVCFLGRIDPPGPVRSALSGFAACIGPLSMLTIGVLLAETKLKEALWELRLYRVVFLRLFLYPVMAGAVLLLVSRLWSSPDKANILMVSLLCAIGPSAATVTQLAQLLDSPEKCYVSSINAITTMLCVVTIPVMCGLFLTLV